MFEDVYPCIIQRINSIDNDILKVKLKDNINSIKLNIANVLFINDYEITCKIEQHYLNINVPILRNSNSVTIRNPYSSYIYYLCIYILNSSNYNECYSHGEFVITFDYLYILITELELMINKIIKNNNYVDPLDEIKMIFTELIDNTCEHNKYMYLLQEENQNVESSSTESDNKLEKITDNYTENYNNNYNNKIYLFDDNLIESDDESIKSEKTDTLINDLRTNLVNILGQ